MKFEDMSMSVIRTLEWGGLQKEGSVQFGGLIRCESFLNKPSQSLGLDFPLRGAFVACLSRGPLRSLFVMQGGGRGTSLLENDCRTSQATFINKPFPWAHGADRWTNPFSGVWWCLSTHTLHMPTNLRG